MSDYEARRQANIRRNQALLHELKLPTSSTSPAEERKARPRPAKRQKTGHASAALPTRTSARIASSTTQVVYNASPSPPPSKNRAVSRRTLLSGRAERPTSAVITAASTSPDPLAHDLAALRASWTAWTSEGDPPTRDDADGTLHFTSHPIFTPNKTPAEILREGCFGGTYFRPLFSKALGTTIEDDWRELPAEWVAGLDVERMLTSSTYDPAVNKYGVSCGQSIEEWEAAGWINHEFDVRGWFQWYCRFYMGRRCDDDERQISRWKKCVGETGRWRRILLKKYVALGIRSVFAEDEEGEDEEGAAEVSPVVHQTCHHWAWQVRQEVLDRFWETGT